MSFNTNEVKQLYNQTIKEIAATPVMPQTLEEELANTEIMEPGTHNQGYNIAKEAS